MSHLHFKFLSLKCEVTIMSLEWILRYDKVVSESINKFDMKVYLESVWQWFSKVFLPLKSLLSVFGMKIRCLVSFKKHFWKFGKTLKVIFKESLDRCFFFFKKKTLQNFKIFQKCPQVIFDTSLSLSLIPLFFNFPPSLSTWDYTVGKVLHFCSTSLIWSKVTLCSFLVFLFLVFNVWLSWNVS